MSVVYDVLGVQKSYISRMVLDIDHLEINRGEILAIVGPSGSGKSTFLRILNFLEPPDNGQVRFFDEVIDYRNVPLAAQRSVTTVFQHPSLLSASVATNILFGLRLRGEKDGRDGLNHLLKRVGLEHLARKQAYTLSGGEAQRVALARALILEPRVLLLDEPSANLDPYNVELIESVIRDLNHSNHTTIVMVTHNIFQAHRLADRVVFMLNGKIVESADTQTFFENPADARTRAFIRGEMVW
ncbi:MAG: ABC transporter ATP-binding protein [Bellilinea sp.]